MKVNPMVTPELFEELNCRLEAVEAQRNRALTDAAIAQGRLAVTQQALDKLKTEAAALNTRLAALVTTQEA